MPGGRSNPKVAKKRDELLATFDLLTSHLHTTFMALSTAYAKCKLAKTQDSSPVDGENAPPEPQGVHQGRLRTAHLMFVLGPSAHAAKARIILTIDGLEVKVWGARVAEEVDSDEESEEDSESDYPEEEDVSDENSEGETGSDDEEESGEDASDSESSGPGSGPPSSRSPSPCSPSTRSLAPSPESLPSPRVLPTPLPSQSGFILPPVLLSSQPASHGCVVPQSTPPPLPAPESGPAPSQRTPASCDTAHISPTLVPELSYADEQKALRAAERLLSRTLMNAWVNNADAGTENNHELGMLHVLLNQHLTAIRHCTCTRLSTPPRMLTHCPQPQRKPIYSCSPRAASCTQLGLRVRTSRVPSTLRSPPSFKKPVQSRRPQLPQEASQR